MFSLREWSRLSYLTVQKFRTVVETRRNRPRIVRTRCVPVCGHRAVYFGLGLALLQAQIRPPLTNFRRCLLSTLPLGRRHRTAGEIANLIQEVARETGPPFRRSWSRTFEPHHPSNLI